MRTAVQLRRTFGAEAPTTELVYGQPSEFVTASLGPVAVFGSGVVVAYLLRYRRRQRLFVFRTLDVDDAMAASVPGVSPRVQLLMALRTAGRVRLARRLFAYVVRLGRDPSALPDAVYVHVAAVLEGRLPPHRILPALLSQVGASETRGSGHVHPRRWP